MMINMPNRITDIIFFQNGQRRHAAMPYNTGGLSTAPQCPGAGPPVRPMSCITPVPSKVPVAGTAGGWVCGGRCLQMTLSVTTTDECLERSPTPELAPNPPTTGHPILLFSQYRLTETFKGGISDFVFFEILHRTGMPV